MLIRQTKHHETKLTNVTELKPLKNNAIMKLLAKYIPRLATLSVQSAGFALRMDYIVPESC
jgi:hypothetical protein